MATKFRLTGPILTQVAPVIRDATSVNIAALFTEICPAYGIDRAGILHEFIANVLHESACLTVLSENMNYSVHALLTKFGRHRISAADAERFGRKTGQPANQRRIAELLYGGKWGRDNLGNRMPGDGWTFRGCGPIQLTGRSNVTRFTAFYNMKFSSALKAGDVAELLRTDLRMGIHSACWVFSIAKGLNDEAENDDMRAIVKKINGAYLGWDDRSKYYERAKRLIVDI